MRRVKRVAFLVLLFPLLPACTAPGRVHKVTVPSITLKKQTVTSGKKVFSLPAGIYTADFEDKEGVYYTAPWSIEQVTPKTPFGSDVWLHGGILISNPDSEDQRHAIWTYTEKLVPVVGILAKERPLKLIRLDDKIALE